MRTWSNEGLNLVLGLCSVDQIYYPDILSQISSTLAFGPLGCFMHLVISFISTGFLVR